MSENASIYSNNQFQVAIRYEANVGTINDTTMQLVNVDMPITINDNPVIVSDYRSGAGRTKKSADYFATEAGQLKSISFGGILDTTVGKILLENCTGIEEGSSPNTTVDIPFDYAPTAFLHNASSSNKNTFTLTFALVSPIGTNTRLYPGCIVDELVFTEDQGTDGGRRHFTCTLLTKYNPSNDQATPGSMSAYGSTYYSIYDYTRHIFGDSTDDKVLWKVEMALKSNPRFFCGENGIPELMNRGYPGFEANVMVSMKYDDNSMSEYLKYFKGTSIEADILDLAIASDPTTGFKSAKMQITADLNLTDNDDGTFIDVSAECLGDTSGDLIQIAI